MSERKGRDENPFKPGAGHSPPYLAGRERESAEFLRFLEQDAITQNIVLTGLRGVGKTVLMDDVYKPLALDEEWIWVGSDFSESAFVDEITLCQRLLTDLSAFTSTLELETDVPTSMGLQRGPNIKQAIDFDYLIGYFNAQPGLHSDKLKATLELVWRYVDALGKRGVLFAYDEAQVVQDRKEKDQYPLALLLETFQSIQRKGAGIMLLLTGLPTLFPRLVESRTYAERMFKIQEIGRLDAEAARLAITEPLIGNPVRLSDQSIETIVSETCGYPYFIQFICRETYDICRSASNLQRPLSNIPIKTLIKKLDSDFFAGRWSRIPDRQRELLFCVAYLDNAGAEFTVNQVVEISQRLAERHEIKPFKTGDVSAMIPKLIGAGLVYKNRHGKYSLAVPLLDRFIKRQFESPISAQ
jgi:AAA ATPase domain